MHVGSEVSSVEVVFSLQLSRGSREGIEIVERASSPGPHCGPFNRCGSLSSGAAALF